MRRRAVQWNGSGGRRIGRGEKVGKDEMCVRSREKTIRSRSLEMNERLAIGRLVSLREGRRGHV